MEYQEILFEIRDRVGWITLNRPNKRNPIGPRTVGELCHLLRRVRQDAGVGVVVLTGAGGNFSAGGDLSAMGGQGADAAALKGGFADLNLLFTRLGKPSIAMIRGAAMGGGLGLVAACDMAVAAQTAVLGTPEIKVGLWPMIISVPLARCIGRRQALRLMLTGQKLSAAEALAVGLVGEVVPEADLEQRVEALAGQLATRSPLVLQMGLDAFNTAQGMDLEPALRYLEKQLWAVLCTEDAMEGIQAFMQKRAPRFKGR